MSKKRQFMMLTFAISPLDISSLSSSEKEVFSLKL
jgi:hypothetical protein